MSAIIRMAPFGLDEDATAEVTRLWAALWMAISLALLASTVRATRGR